MAFAPALRKLTFTTHVTSFRWMDRGVFLALAAIRLTSQDEPTVRGAYLVMAPAAWVRARHADRFASGATPEVTAGGERRWEYALWILAPAILGLIVLSHVAGSGSHGH